MVLYYESCMRAPQQNRAVRTFYKVDIRIRCCGYIDLALDPRETDVLNCAQNAEVGFTYARATNLGTRSVAST